MLTLTMLALAIDDRNNKMSFGDFVEFGTLLTLSALLEGGMAVWLFR